MKIFAPAVYKTLVLILLVLLTACAARPTTPDPLPSWSEGNSKQQIVNFVDAVTNSDSSDYVATNQRVATFDNDGTLWSEKPTYFQLIFVLDRVKSMAADHPEWTNIQPFKAVLENDMASLKAEGHKGLYELLTVTHAGMTKETFDSIVGEWLSTATHPATGLPYTAMVYQPMLELLDYLRANGFKVFIVSGGGLEFMRPWTESVYGIPPDQVVGSSFETRYEVRDGIPVIVRDPELHFLNDKETKPVAINRFIGQRPILAFGNSDGDFQMLEWTTAGSGKRLGLLLHHTDADREWAYDRESSEGRLDRGLDEAQQRGWVVVDMQKDWRVVFPGKAGK